MRMQRGFGSETQGSVQQGRVEFDLFLKSLGYSYADSVFLRLLPPKELKDEYVEFFPDLFWWKDGNPVQSRKKLRLQNGRLYWQTTAGEIFLSGDPYGWLRQQNRIGLAVYIVVNPGGHTLAEIAGSRVIFWEDDKRSKSDQLARFDELQEKWGGGFAVETRSSIHCYFRHDEFLDPIDFSITQLRLIKQLDSDPSIWDAPRLMRVPGFDHTKVEGSGIIRTPVSIVRPWDGDVTRFTWIDQALPAPTDEMLEQVLGGSKSGTIEVRPMSDDPNDLRNVVQMLPHFQQRSADWVTAQIPAPGVTSTDGFQVNQHTGRYKVWSGTVSKTEALKAVAAYASQKDSRISLSGIIATLRGEAAEPSGDEFDQEWYNSLVAQQEEQERYDQIESEGFAARAKQERINAHRQRVEAVQAEYNSLRVLPTVKMAGLYIPKNTISLPEKPGIVLIGAPMNSGKTSNGLTNIVKQHRERHPDAERFLGVPRRILARQAGRVLDLPVMTPELRAPIKEAALCLESIGRLGMPDQLSESPLLILDEPSQTFKQLLYGDTTKGRHAFVLGRFRAYLKTIGERNGSIVLCEDRLTNLELDFIAEASGLEVIEYVQFDKEVTPRDITIYDSQTLTWEEIKERLDRGENVIVAADAQRWLREVEETLIDQLELHPDSVRIIDHESAEEFWVRDFVDDPTAWIREHKPRFLGYSPTLSSGVSIEDPDGYFAAQGFRVTHLEPRDAAQLVERLRSNVPLFGDIKEFGIRTDDLLSDCRPESILKAMDRNRKGVERLTGFADYVRQREETGDLLAHMQQLEEQKDDPTTDYGSYRKHYARYKSRENYNRLNLRDNLITLWQSRGHRAEYKPLGKIRHCVSERIEARERIDRREAEAFAALDTADQTVEQARSILDKIGSTREARRQARKRLLQDKLPGCPLNDKEFVLKAIIRNSGRFLKATELLWLSQNPEAAQFLDRVSWHGAYTHAARHGLFVADHRLPLRSVQARLLHDCPLAPFITGQVDRWQNETPEALAVKDWAVLHSVQLRRALRIVVKDDHTPCQVVNKLLKKLGFICEEIAKPGKRGEKRDRVYSIANLRDIDRAQILSSLSERLEIECGKRGESVPASVGQVQAANIAKWKTRIELARSKKELFEAFTAMKDVYPERKHPTKQAVWEQLDRGLKLQIQRLLEKGKPAA